VPNPYVVVGTNNFVKEAAVSELLATLPAFANADVQSLDVPSGVSAQPRSLQETWKGAYNRAQAAYHRAGATYGIGIESGVYRMWPSSQDDNVFDVCACVILGHARRGVLRGLSSAWPVPPKVAKLIYECGYDMDKAFLEAGYTDDPRIGKSGGAISILSHGRIDRKAYTQQAILAALMGAPELLEPNGGSLC
jgi:inosine/xanthosine triphosphatase